MEIKGKEPELVQNNPHPLHRSPILNCQWCVLVYHMAEFEAWHGSIIGFETTRQTRQPTPLAFIETPIHDEVSELSTLFATEVISHGTGES